MKIGNQTFPLITLPIKATLDVQYALSNGIVYASSIEIGLVTSTTIQPSKALAFYSVANAAEVLDLLLFSGFYITPILKHIL